MASIVQKVQAAVGIGAVPVQIGQKLETGVKLKDVEATVNLDDVEGKIVIVGVPGAFTPTCSNQVPGYIKELQNFLSKGIKTVYVVSVNDVFVTEAWKEKLGAGEESKIKFLADDSGKWTSAIGMCFDAIGLLGNLRSHRYAMVVNNGVIEALEQEPDDGKVTNSAADKLLAKL